MVDFVAFRAMIQLIKEHGKDYLLGEVYENCQRSTTEVGVVNYVKELYKQFTPDEISNKIADIVKPEGMNAEVEVVFQTIENLHKAIPNHIGDWYFTGNYPTPGGMHVANRSYLNYMDGKLVRAY
jgi:amidophosphoribosyltransferase